MTAETELLANGPATSAGGTAKARPLRRYFIRVEGHTGFYAVSLGFYRIILALGLHRILGFLYGFWCVSVRGYLFVRVV